MSVSEGEKSIDKVTESGLWGQGCAKANQGSGDAGQWSAGRRISYAPADAKAGVLARPAALHRAALRLVLILSWS